MNKIFKRITLALSLIVAVVCMCSFVAACGEEQDKDYTITVVYSDGSPVNGTNGADGEPVTLQICSAKMTGTTVSCFAEIYQVSADGKVVIQSSKWPELATNLQYHLQLNNPPAGYTYDESATYLTEPSDLTITLIAE